MEKIIEMSSFLFRENIDSYYSKKSYFLLAFIICLGMILRFWGLGNVGLHGDEETMAMPAIEILKSGFFKTVQSPPPCPGRTAGEA